MDIRRPHQQSSGTEPNDTMWIFSFQTHSCLNINTDCRRRFENGLGGFGRESFTIFLPDALGGDMLFDFSDALHDDEEYTRSAAYCPPWMTRDWQNGVFFLMRL